MPRGPSLGGSWGPFTIGRRSGEAVALTKARVEPNPSIKNLSKNPLFVNGLANLSKNLLCTIARVYVEIGETSFSFTFENVNVSHNVIPCFVIFVIKRLCNCIIRPPIVAFKHYVIHYSSTFVTFKHRKCSRPCALDVTFVPISNPTNQIITQWIIT